MAFIDGGSAKDLARHTVIDSLARSDPGTKKSIDDIVGDKKSHGIIVCSISIADFARMCAEEASALADRRYLRLTAQGTYVLSRDEQGRYSFEPGNLYDRFRALAMKYRSKLF